MSDSDNDDEQTKDADGVSPKKAPDTLSQEGALALAKRLQAYWHDKGFHAVRFWTEPVAERFAKVGTYELYRVCCNLTNGLPPVYKESRTSDD